MYVVKTGCLAFGCHSLGVSSPMVACSGYTWHTTGFFSHRSSSCSHHWSNGFCQTMAHPWAGRPFWAWSSLGWPSWPSWPSCFSGPSWAWHSLAWSLPWSSWLWWLSGPSWALSSLAWFLPWSSWSSWYWWLALAWLTPLVFGAYTWWLILGTRWLIENIKLIYFFCKYGSTVCSYESTMCSRQRNSSWKHLVLMKQNTKFRVCMQHL